MTYRYPFLDPTLPLKDRVNDLISRLTLEEKAGFIPTRNQPVERLGIKAWAIGAEGAHGYVDREGNNTTFPQTIGLAAGWDRDLLRRIGEAAATEARVYCKNRNGEKGLAIWSPTVDLERDPRWGRTEEGYGEDPFLTGELSSAYIRGAQGDDPFFLRVSCGPKHFFANNNEKNRGTCSCSIPARCMYEYYLAPFKTAIQKAKAVSMMTAYNEVNGIPMMLHPMLNDIVKKEWGLEGHFVTDGGDFLQTVNAHHYFETHAETLAASLKNGADSMTDSADYSIPAVLEALEKKYISEEELDENLRRIFSIRFRLGHFAPAGLCPYDNIDDKNLMTDEYVNLAREAVRKSIVLLKNENNIFPINPAKAETIAVIGPLANAVHLDWYSGIPTYLRTPLEGLQNIYGKDKILNTDYRDIVSFTTEDGRPLVLADVGHPKGKLFSVGTKDQTPARFYKEDWGWGCQTLTDAESGLLLESPYWRRNPDVVQPAPIPDTAKPKADDIKEEQCVIAASGKNTLSWFAYSVFNLTPQENGLIIMQTFDNRRIAASASCLSDQITPVILNDDPLPGSGELFRMKIEKEGIPQAIDAAAKTDKVIFIGGNNPMINGRECTDRPSMNLPPFQEEFIRRVIDVNPKTALVLISGYPFTIKDISEKIPAILWMAPGIQETGNGLADIIGGNYSPAGRLPLTWYEDEKQLPSIMEYDIISAGTTYQYFTGKVLWPFGHGLSYSNFEYSELCIDKTSAGENDIVGISFKVKNNGSCNNSEYAGQSPAEEVPQMYITFSVPDNISGSLRKPMVRPVKTLKGFDRISLTSGEERIVRFELPVNELAFWDSYNGRFCVEAGNCKVSIGASSEDIRLTGNFDVHGEIFSARKISNPIYAERFDNYANCFLHEKRGSSIPAVFNNACTGSKSGTSEGIGLGAYYKNKSSNC
ncbi:MAG: glycoside hydrolase family 3 C-terminal domain-containing protein, partial [Treponema sp.]|nr:glycoside hydrolase family 3 C-terminal domain-containing protein [Treponema sp.]